MSTEEVFVQQFAKLFVHYRDALALDADYTTGPQLDGWNALPSAERDRMRGGCGAAGPARNRDHQQDGR